MASPVDFAPLVALLPLAIRQRAKAVAAAVLSIATFLGTVLPLVNGAPAWVSTVLGLVLAAATSLIVEQTTNAPKGRHEQ